MRDVKVTQCCGTFSGADSVGFVLKFDGELVRFWTGPHELQALITSAMSGLNEEGLRAAIAMAEYRLKEKGLTP